MASFLPPAFSWLAPYVPYLLPLQLDVDAMCALEPPALPSIDAEDLWNLLTKGYAGLAVSVGFKFTQLMHYIAWYKLCRCVDLSVPTMPTPPAAPSPLPALNPPALVTGQPTTYCKRTVGNPVDYSPNNGLFGQGAVFDPTRRFSSVRWTWTISVITPPGPNITLTISQVDVNNGDAVQFSKSFNTFNFSGTYSAMAYGNANGATALVKADATAGLTRVQMTTELFCDGDVPGGITQPCCPPDTIAQGQLLQLLQTVTLLQRYLLPFATIDGMEHTGLTGSGEIEIQGLVGARILLEVPENFGVDYGHPDQRYDLGWINWGTDAGWHSREQLTANPYRSTPAAAPAATRLGYSLSPGVVADIVELRAEP